MEDNQIPKIGVIVAGAWGTVLGNLLADKEYMVDLWVREKEVYDQIMVKRMNETFLPGIVLDHRLNPVKTYEEASVDKDIAFIVVPSYVFRNVLIDMRPYLPKEVSLITATK
ncbi:MAG: hypothetical protein JW932_17605 [Deltaproteobacteria bacterium]|nr:hypothetical protein [Deltaproteobacteria bacterium]